jgi:purine-nucleoside phosphorylase
MSIQEWDILQETAEHVKAQIDEVPEIGLILGSGLSNTLTNLENPKTLPWNDLPNFPQPTVEGHSGAWEFGRAQGKNILVQRGRVHYYEGRPMRELVLPVRVMKMIGVQKIIITNAAGAINENFRVGDFVAIKDHINFIPDSPLRGPNVDELGPRFFSMNDAYSSRLREIALQSAQDLDVTMHEGVYVAFQGPMFETPQEIKAFRTLGGDLAGMSTVPEIIAAQHCGLESLGISCVTNMAAGMVSEGPTHIETLSVTQQKEEDLSKVLELILSKI